MQATKWLKPLVSGSRTGDRASLQAATRPTNRGCNPVSRTLSTLSTLSAELTY